MVDPRSDQRWVPEDVHRLTVRNMRGWIIALGVVVVIGTLVLGGLMIRAFASTSPFPVVVSSPRDCRLSADTDSPKLYVAIDTRNVIDGSLSRGSAIGYSGMEVDALGIVSSLPPLATLDDVEITRIAQEADEILPTFSESEESAVVVAVIDTAGRTSGRVDGLWTRWIIGEPAVEQDLPLGIEFDETDCTVTTAG